MSVCVCVRNMERVNLKEIGRVKVRKKRDREREKERDR